MFRTAVRRTSAYPLQLRQARQPSLNRSVCNHNARPALHSRYNNMRASQFMQLPQSRPLSFARRIRLQFREASKGIWRKNPIMFPLAIFSVVGGTAVFAYAAYVELTQVGPQYRKFPPPVEASLRTAVYYTEIDINPPKALNAYKEALRIAMELGMHPYSDEVLGIKLQVAFMLEKAGLMKPAIQVLERTKNEALQWVEEGREMETAERKVEEGQIPAQAKVVPENIQIHESEMKEEEELKKTAEFEARQRNKTLKKIVGIQMKLAELYASEHIQEEKKAEAAQVAAVELSLKEMRRRQKLGLPVDGGDDDSWLNLTELATNLAELASTYSAKERHELAMPLYLRALDMIREAEGDSPTCKQVVLLNDVASAMAGQLQRPPARAAQQVSPAQTVDAARQWAQKAIDVAARIQRPVRDEECDLTCVVATYNLGELAELQNKPDVARQRYTEAKSLAKGMGYEEGITMADAALKRFAKK